MSSKLNLGVRYYAYNWWRRLRNAYGVKGRYDVVCSVRSISDRF